MNERRRTPAYIFFYLLFLPDTWQVIVGLCATYFLTPLLLQPGMGTPGIAMLYMMVATIGYAGSRALAQALTRRLKKWVLGDRQPS